METNVVILITIILLILGLIVLTIGLIKDSETLEALGIIIFIVSTSIGIFKEVSLQEQLNQCQQTPIEKNRIYEYEVSGNDTIPIDTIYTEGMSGRTYYYK